ncbi:MAG: hypothetical protein ABWZ15_13305, partial [Acidimicrobiia bacterium]
RYRTAAGIIEADAVDVVDPARISNAEARRSGYPSAPALVADLSGTPDLPVYRIRFHKVDEPDPRAVKAATNALTDADVADIDARLDRLDRASSHGPWTAAVLAVIAEHPARRAGDLAPMFDRELPPFKTDVRKLKNLGLTLSLEVGYELSPRGWAYLRLSRRRPAPGIGPAAPR